MPSCYARPTTKPPDITVIPSVNMQRNDNISQLLNINVNYTNLSDNYTNGNVSEVLNSNGYYGIGNGSYTNTTKSTDDYEDSFLFRQFGVIRLVVLGVVIMILILSTCKLVLKMFSRSITNKGDDDY
jgi:hypothetical protein